jgi:GNAT superfamily N-acetyltransferase
MSVAEMAAKYDVDGSYLSKVIRKHGLKIADWTKNPRLKIIKSNTTKKLWQDESYQCKIKQSSTRLWLDNEYRATVSSGISNALLSNSDAVSERSKALWSSDEYRAKVSNKMSELYNTAKYKKMLSDSSTATWAKSEHKNKMANILATMPRSLTKPHLKVCAILDALNVSYLTEHVIGPWVFDIFIPSHNILIEVQGDYWHAAKDRQVRDQAKATYIKEYFPQYQLKYIWEHECLTMGLVEAKIKYWLGIDQLANVRYDFNDIGIALVDKDEADAFLYNWHYQHHGNHGLDIGCYVNMELIAVARFASPHRKEIATSIGYEQSDVLELSRFCIHPKYQKKNLGSWFLARCEMVVRNERKAIKCLVSFADATHNHTGIIYRASNWKLERIVEPNYWYVNEDGWIKHKKTLWNHAKKMGLSEVDYATKYNYTKVFGKEKYKFSKVLV